MKIEAIGHSTCSMSHAHSLWVIDYIFHHAYVSTLEYIKMFEKLNIFPNIHRYIFRGITLDSDSL